MKKNIIKILLIDDDEDYKIIIKDMLDEIESSEYELTWTKGIEEALNGKFGGAVLSALSNTENSRKRGDDENVSLVLLDGGKKFTSEVDVGKVVDFHEITCDLFRFVGLIKCGDSTTTGIQGNKADLLSKSLADLDEVIDIFTLGDITGTDSSVSGTMGLTLHSDLLQVLLAAGDENDMTTALR